MFQFGQELLRLKGVEKTHFLFPLNNVNLNDGPESWKIYRLCSIS